MENTMKLAGAILIVVTLLCSLNVLPASFELQLAGLVLGGALAAQHVSDVLSEWIRGLMRFLRARAQKDGREGTEAR